jgi:hypothetical protein
MLALASALQYITVAVLQGPKYVAKGMLLFAFLYDMTMVAAVALVTHRWVQARRGGRAADHGRNGTHEALR